MEFRPLLKLSPKTAEFRNLSFSPALKLKQSELDYKIIYCLSELTTENIAVIEEKKGNEIIIRGEHIPSPREPYLVKNEHPSKCPVCSTGLELKHTDVLILSQFLRSDGCILPKRITGLCKRQQRRVATLVAMAQKAGLMPNITPANSKKDPKKRNGWKKFNKYFDETTIKIRGL